LENALARADYHYRFYGQRARELSEAGTGAIGYLCALTPVELIHAAGLIPLRIKGFPEDPVTEADAQMETIICSVVRAWYDGMRKGRFDFIRGLVIPHACDSMVRTYDIWANTLELPFVHFIDIPHATTGSAPAFFKAVLETFREMLTRRTGREITDAAITGAVREYNRYRLAVQALYALRRESPPRISGVEVTKTLVAGLCLPVNEAIELVAAVTAEALTRPPVTSAKRPRIMLFGAEQDNIGFVETVEQTGADVVADYFCPGLREYSTPVPETPDPMDGIADRYLTLNCARTYREGGPESRFGEIGEIAAEYGAQGMILMIRRYCDPFGFEVPALKQYLEGQGLPVLYLEEDYAPVAARIATRVQAFLEMLPGGGR
jgi:benzoyl-CoA reductase subunit C